MSASAQIRKYAASIANSHPGIAFDLANMAFKLAEDEQQEEQGQQGQQEEQGQQGQQGQQKQAGQVPEAFKEHMKEKKEEGEDEEEGQKQAAYRTLKSSVIAAARANPNLRAAFVPVLLTIKRLG